MVCWSRTEYFVLAGGDGCEAGGGERKEENASESESESVDARRASSAA